MRIDLHSHSDASDGTDSPADLVSAAERAGLDVVALTDHDTTAGWDDAAAALSGGVRLVRGMEMSCTARADDGYPVSVHLLAYLFDRDHPALAAERERLRAERVRRMRAMVAAMVRDGVPIDPDAVLASGGDTPGRPHLARALVEAGQVPDIAAAFAGPLSPRGRYYLRKRDTPVDDAVRMVTDAGGVAVLAHPRARSRGRVPALDQVEYLADLGLAGLEVDHPDHSEADRAVLRDLARGLRLVATGSSDYHGANKSIALGEFRTDAAVLDEIVDRATGAGVLG